MGDGITWGNDTDLVQWVKGEIKARALARGLEFLESDIDSAEADGMTLVALRFAMMPITDTDTGEIKKIKAPLLRYEMERKADGLTWQGRLVIQFPSLVARIIDGRVQFGMDQS